VIRVLAHAGDKPVVMLGLDAQGLNRLREGQPIQVNLRHLDPTGAPTDLPDIDVVIFFGGADEIKLLFGKSKREAP
jgi:hypothetical protein